MNRTGGQRGFTLVELLVVAAIIVVMASALVGVGRRMLTRAQEKLARSTLDIVVTAIEQYHGELGRFPIPLVYDQTNKQLLPINAGFTEADLKACLNDDLGLSRRIPPETVTIPSSGILPIECDLYAVSECLYYFLFQCPNSRRMIDTIADSQKTAMDTKRMPRQAVYKDATGKVVTITLIRLVDPWGTPLRYEYTPGEMSFPRVTSAGPDRLFGTTDDLRSDE
jgi:prepilin-type N-terminal cleavage/methylation domain-containing protein